MGDSEQQLFLAEFLVDRVNVPSIRAMHTEMLPVTTCVSFQILNLPPINIYQESSSENCTCPTGDTQIFKKGKSCLFALPSIVLEKPIGSFPINLSVYKKLPPGVLPDVMLIGCNQIETRDLINSMLNRHVFKSGNPCKTMKETFKLTTATGQRVGEVTVFIRMSCFGKKIVTQFQIPHNKKPYLFKGTENSPVFQCKRISSNLEEKVATTRCNCEKTRQRTSNDDASDEKIQTKTCCPVTILPPCPPPTRQFSANNLSPRPCCPSNRGQQCPSSLPAESIKSRKDSKMHQRDERKFHQTPNDNQQAARNSGCFSIKEQKTCNCG